MTNAATAHDYYEDTLVAWDSVQLLIRSGALFSYPNPVTGTLTTESELVEKSKQ
jgi:hypothetical protein